MSKKHAVGIVVQNRIDLTMKTLQSLFHTDQPKETYDLYIIDNGSDQDSSNDLTDWANSSIVPVKNLVRTKKRSLSSAWNLFLSMTANYPFRTKLDNDLIFANTPVAARPFEREKKGHTPSPGDFGVNPGAIPSASFVVGGGHKISTKKSDTHHTCFLEHLEESISGNKLGICALPPVTVGRTLVQSFPILGAMTWREKPVLCGGCMTITKDTFDKLGYFEPSLPCSIDWEYAQRAMAIGVNVGYTPNYCVIHLGESDPTLSAPIRQQQKLEANNIGLKLGFRKEFVHCEWEQVSEKIFRALNSSMIVNLT